MTKTSQMYPHSAIHLETSTDSSIAKIISHDGGSRTRKILTENYRLLNAINDIMHILVGHAWAGRETDSDLEDFL